MVMSIKLMISNLFEGSIDALKALKEMGYLLVLVTNQSGIARGYFSEDQFFTTYRMDGLVVS